MPRSLSFTALAVVTALIGVAAASFTVTWLDARGSGDPYLTLNLASRTGALSQRIAKDLLLFSQSDGAARAARAEAIDLASHTLSATLDGFARGGAVPIDLEGTEAVVLDALGSLEERAALAELLARWRPYRENLARVVAGAGDALLLAQLVADSGALFEAAEALAAAVQGEAHARATRALRAQGALAALALLIGAWVVVRGRRRLLEPLAALTEAAQRVSGGELDTPAHLALPRELGALGDAIERLRVAVRSLLHERMREEREGELGPRR